MDAEQDRYRLDSCTGRQTCRIRFRAASGSMEYFVQSSLCPSSDDLGYPFRLSSRDETHRFLQYGDRLSEYRSASGLETASAGPRLHLRLDIITVGRQLLGNYFLTIKEEFDRMYGQKDLQALKMKAAEMRKLLDELEQLTAFHSHTSVAGWLSDARAYGDTPELKDYYEKNARNLITTWGGSLNDYANRTWAGLVSHYYAKRWDMYLDAVISAVEENREFSQDELDERMTVFEESWVQSTHPIVTTPGDDLLDYARSLLSKYEDKILYGEGAQPQNADYQCR